MNKIAFSHRYYKLPTQSSKATLCFVTKTTVKELPDNFLDYDTSYISRDGVSHYDLSKLKEVLVLSFLPIGEFYIFTTIRRWTPQKEEYYRSKSGQEFEIVIEED